MRSRLSSLRPRSTRLVAATAVLIALPFATAAQGVGAGDADPIELTGAYAAPMTGTTPVCTPEPAGRRAYGTDVAFDAVRQLAESIPTLFQGTGSRDVTDPNVPSVANIDQNLQAGASTDFCVGFTLSPNQEDQLVAATTGLGIQRYAETSPALPDHAASHALDGTRGDDLDAVRVSLPAGFAAAVDDAPQCTDTEFGTGDYLPVATTPNCTHAIVGTGFARATTNLLGMHIAMGGLQNANPGATFMAGGTIYNLTHSPDEFARLGVTIKGVSGQAPAKFTVRVVSAPDGSGSLDAIVTGAPRVLYLNGSIDPATGQPKASTPTTPAPTPYEMYVESIGMRIWGSAADHPVPTTDTPTTPKPGLTADFAQNGTDCSANARATVAISTYGGTSDEIDSQGYQLTGCGSLPFNPSVDVTIPTSPTKQAGEPTGLTVRVGVEQTSSGLESALLRNASVTLPAGLELGAQYASRAGGLRLCTATAFAKTDVAPASCPAASKVGDVQVETPLLNDPLEGSVYLGEQSAVGELPALYLEMAPQGATPAGLARIKLVGSVAADASGQVTTTFTDAPQLRFSALTITFPDGPDALFVTPRTCGTATAQSSFTSWASSTPVQRTSSVAVNAGCSAPSFAPTIAMSAQDAQAGGSSPTTVTITRPDRSAWMRTVSVALPSGFLADLTKATECSQASATAGTCGAESRIATVTTDAGAGANPYRLTGSMYLVERQSGDVAGASIKVRAQLGDLDLGDVIVPARIALRQTDAGLTLTTTVPERFRGLPLLLQRVAVTVDRTDFPVSPTACGPLPVNATITSDASDTASPSSEVSYTGCGSLPFSPAIDATLSGTTAEGQHPELKVKVTARAGDSNLKATTVTLPAGIGADLANTRNACTQEQWAAASCPDSTRVGSATARVRITTEEIPGDVYLVTVPGKSLPGLGLNFTGRYAQRLLSSVQIIGDRLTATFGSIPDLPLTSLDLTVNGGARSPLVYLKDVCTTASAFNTTFTAQGTQTATRTQAFTCTAPSTGSTAPTIRWFASRGFTALATAPSGTSIQSMKLTLPSGFKFKAGTAATIKRYLRVTTTGGRVRSRITNRSLTLVRTTTPGPLTAQINVKARGISAPKSRRYRNGLKKGMKIKLRVRTAFMSGTATTSTITVTLR